MLAKGLYGLGLCKSSEVRASRLRLNPTKTQVMWLGSSQQLAIARHLTRARSVVMRKSAGHSSYLGVVIDRQLSLSAHIAAICRSGYYQLRQLRQVVRSLSEDAIDISPGVRFLPPGWTTATRCFSASLKDR